MKRCHPIAVLVLLAPVLFACAYIAGNSAAPDIPAARAGALRLASYNVHYIRLSRAEGPWSVGDWERRRRPMRQALDAIDADVVAFQEMESFAHGDDGATNLARDYLLAELPRYAAGATGDWRRFPSTQPIFYRRDRFRLVDQGWFFFSDRPDVIYSRTFDGSYPAFASWVRLRPRDGGPDFRVVNVHLDYRSGANRLASAALVRDRVAPWIAADEPVAVLGDLNALRGSRTAGLLREAGLDFTPVRGSTYHFDRGLNLFGAIDHIATSDGFDPLGPPVVLRRRFGGEWPSDHYPLIADYSLDGSPPDAAQSP